MTPSEAQRAIESLRKGIPPDGYVRQFTVGRKAEIDSLHAHLQHPAPGALLLRANYGAGKSHLLRFIREVALEEGYAVSSVTLDAKSAVRFNKLDQIVGAIWRGLEVPGIPGDKGVRPFFSVLFRSIEESRRQDDRQSFWHKLSDGWKWDHSEELDSPALYVALRAWRCGGLPIQDFIEDWLFQPWVYGAQRKQLYQRLVEELRRSFRDPRQEWQFYADEVFSFSGGGYQQSWATLRDVQKLALAAGLKGFIVLFDEFEDILTNLNNINWQEAALWNLFQFYSGKQFPGMTFFAVTPEFTDKCKRRLLEKDRWDYDYSRFDKLPTFEMSPLNARDLDRVAEKISETHGIAFGWNPKQALQNGQLGELVRTATAVAVQDRARHTIRTIVAALDRVLEDS